MGLPTTWALLSVLHSFMWDLAIRSTADRRGVPYKAARAANKFIICGDDGLFVGWQDVSDAFSLLTQRCGFEFSAGKHFVCAHAPFRAVFLERLYTFKADKFGTVVSTHKSESVPLRALVQPEAMSLDGDRILKVHRTILLLNAISSINTDQPSCRRAILRFLRRRPAIRGFAESVGLRHGYPLSLGGSGLPLVDRADTDNLKLFQKETGRTFRSLLKGVVDPMWKLAEDLVMSDTLNDEKGWQLVDSSTECPKDCDRLDYTMHCERSTALQYHSLILGIGPGDNKSVKGLPINQLRKALVGWWADYDKFVPSGVQTIYQVRRITSPLKGRPLPARWIDKTEDSLATVRSQILQML